MSNGTFCYGTDAELKEDMRLYIEQNEIHADFSTRGLVRVTGNDIDDIVAYAKCVGLLIDEIKIELYKDFDGFEVYELFVTLYR